ncbi:MAG: MFS transporter, partial [Chlamydiota bacterium]
PSILAIASAVFIVPFLLFSSAAGVLADRIRKRSILIAMKWIELWAILLSVVAIYYESEFGLYALLFIMAVQSAIFGPSKYSIIPELVKSSDVSKANGALSSFTFLAIILGTFVASFITDITNKNFLLSSGVCVFLAVIGLIVSWKIPRTPAGGSLKKINPFFPYEIYQTLRFCRNFPNLLTVVVGASFFLFLGSFVQLNVIPFAMEALHLSEVGGGYIFVVTSIGIALGCFLGGRLSKKGAPIGLSCVAGFFLSIFLCLLSIFSSHLIIDLILLVFLGVCGGIFLVPLDSFMQINSPDEKRGQIVATANFLSFTGALLASICLYVFSNIFHISAAGGFFLMGLITFVFTFFLAARTSDLFFFYLGKQVFFKIFPVQMETPPPLHSLFLCKNRSWLYVILFFGFFPQIGVVFWKPRSILRFLPLNSVFFAYKKETLFSKIEEMRKSKNYILILGKEFPWKEELCKAFSFSQPFFIHLEKKDEKRYFSFSTEEKIR